MALMTEDDHYQVHVYPQAQKASIVFIGDCWEYSEEMTFNYFLRPLINHYSKTLVSWADRETIAEGYYQFTWERPVLDIKGDG